MLPENDGPGDRINGEIEAANVLGSEHNTHRPWQGLQQEKSGGPGAWVIYLDDTRIALNVFKTYT
jgi:hypothetical protein